MIKAALSIVTVVFSLVVSTSAFAQATASAGMGKGVFGEPAKTNSCAFCHGATGGGGSVKEAAHLTEPKTWKIYKILGGDAAFAKNKAEFLQKMHDATVHLITKGGITHNVTYKAKNAWFDVSKGGGPYNSQMLGMTTVPAKEWLKKYADKGVTPEIAAESAYLFVQTLDKQGVFK